MPPIFPDSQREAFARDVVDGLGSSPKSLKPKYFYDATGSELFEEITHQPEYYQTRTEAGLLRECAPVLSAFMGEAVSLVELGSGSSVKTAILLESLLETSEELHYLPIDISKTMLRRTADRLDARYPELDITPIASPYEAGLKRASTLVAKDEQVPDRMLVLFLGSSIGNMERDESVHFLKDLREHLQPRDAFLIGFDLQKDVAILNAAYNDAAGITERFNRNILTHINTELGGEFDLDRFAHEAFYNEAADRIEMHLRSQGRQEVAVAACETKFSFAAEETIHTENSYKYTPASIENLAANAGFRVRETFMDEKDWFALALFTPV
jgi:dimethylhistidine N-methyltransferase